MSQGKDRKETERHQRERETAIGFSYTHRPGVKPTTQAGALTGDRTRKLAVHGTMLQPTEPPGQGYTKCLLLNVCSSEEN